MNISRNIAIVLLALILVGSAYLRITNTSIRPFHNDEGVNYHFLEEINRKGYYPYSHENYHGPSYFYISRLMVNMFGDSELGIRSSAILCGLLCILVLGVFAKQESWMFVLLSALGVGISSSLLFYSRYAIHETLFVLSAAVAGFSIVRWWYTESAKWVVLGFIGLAMLITTKETFIITLFCLFFATLAMGDVRRVWQLLLQQKQAFGFGAVVCSFLIVLTFTGGFQWPGGLREMLLAVPQWVNRNEADYGHHKPFAYYGEIFLKTETYLLAIAVLFVLLALFRGRGILFLFRKEAAFGRFLFVWTLLAFLVYSFVSYKTPWLIINISFPAVLLLSWLLVKFIETQGVREAGMVAALGLLVWSGRLSWEYNFTIPYGNKNPFSYVHSSPGVVEFLADLERYWKDRPKALVLIGVNQYWPIPYYTRAKAEQVHYVVSKEPENYTKKYEVIVMKHTVKKDLPGYTRKYYRLSDVEEAQIYYREW